MTETKTEIDRLIERLEKATGPDRELDEAITRATGWTVMDGQPRMWIAPNGMGRFRPPRYTASLDAALTLVPEMQWGVNWDIEGVLGGICVYVWLEHPTHESSFVRSEPAKSYPEAIKQLPRLIALAALRAKQATA